MDPHPFSNDRHFPQVPGEKKHFNYNEDTDGVVLFISHPSTSEQVKRTTWIKKMMFVISNYVFISLIYFFNTNC